LWGGFDHSRYQLKSQQGKAKLYLHWAQFQSIHVYAYLLLPRTGTSYHRQNSSQALSWNKHQDI